ncbi:MAG: DUF1178 family protein [Rhodospirillales bacterium]|nr:DUF1178 family protein [Rhodospirillales bacterium]
MIRYSVQCSKGHVFDEWFDNMADYDVKSADHAIACPDCGDTHVSKALMAPSIGKSNGARELPPPACGTPSACGGCPMAGHVHG